MIKALILDRDGLINHGSKDLSSPFYYICDYDDLVLKPNIYTAFYLLEVLRKKNKLKVILATRQKCISKGLVGRLGVDNINDRLQNEINFVFDGIYVEEKEDSKENIFNKIAKDLDIAPKNLLVIDDSGVETDAAYRLGFQSEYSSDLYHSICKIFQIQ